MTKLLELLAGLIGGKQWLVWLIAAGIGLSALAGVGLWIDHNGYTRAEAEWTIKYDKRELELNEQRFKEIDRQATANAQAKAKEAARLAAEMARSAELEARLLELQAEAEKDPNANRIGLGADSVARLNQIR
jgi:hypothetical protein